MDPSPYVSSRSTIVGMVAFMAISVALLYAAADRIIEDVLVIESAWGQVGEIGIMAGVTSLILWAGVLHPLHGKALSQRQAAEQRQDTLEENAAQQGFESELHRALEMAVTEDMVYRSTTKALTIGLNGNDAELLLADSSDAHLKRALTVTADGPAHCGVISPARLPGHPPIANAAVQLQQRPRRLPSSRRTTHRFLLGGVRAAEHRWSQHRRPAHRRGRRRTVPTQAQVDRLEAIATHAGSRIGMLRVMSATTLQAATDPLTGLLNRRAFENKTHALLKNGRRFSARDG